MDNEEKKIENPMPPEERYAAPEIDDDDDDDAPTEWVPSRFEKRVHAIPEAKWNLYQTLGGAAVGLFTLFALFVGGTGVNAMFLIAIALALLLPNILEDRGRRKLNRARLVLVIVLAVGIVIMLLSSLHIYVRAQLWAKWVLVVYVVMTAAAQMFSTDAIVYYIGVAYLTCENTEPRIHFLRRREVFIDAQPTKRR